MEEALKRLAVLMTVHNRRETTLKCLSALESSVYNQEQYAIDLFITDDGCTDGTAKAVAEAFPLVHLIPGDGNLFWNRGMYKAWESAAHDDYDYYFWVNDDTLIIKDSLARMLNCSRKRLDEAIIVGSTEASDGSGTITYGGWSGLTAWKNGILVTDINEEQVCQTMNGNLVLIPQKVFNILGKNDPYYHHSLGDFDYGLRATEKGISIIITPGVCGICDLHEKPSAWMDPSQPIKKRWRCFFSPTGNNPFEYFHFKNRHFGLLSAFLSFGTNFLHFFFPSLWIESKSSE